MARNSLLFKGGALRQLKRGATKSGGRNNLGRITAFHRGGGAKRSFRLIDTKRNTPGLVGTVERIEYDPFRTARTALIRWEDDADADGEACPVASPPKRAVVKGEIRESNAKMVPRDIHQVSRRELRSAVATICGVSLSDVERNRRRVKVVTVDGRRKFSSSSFTHGVDQGIRVVLPQEEKQILLGTSESCLKEACFGDYSILLKKFPEILKIREAL